MQHVLFLCTGNYYRSRFAEMLFNHLANEAGIAWRADSRALAIERGFMNMGPVSPYVIVALERRSLTYSTYRKPESVSTDDFHRADLIIALKADEHRPLVEERHPQFATRVQYWNVHDTDEAVPAVALAEVEAKVRELIQSLAQPVTRT